jgi:methylated-DNA-[protein]-cysteine S-methyltransferase
MHDGSAPGALCIRGDVGEAITSGPDDCGCVSGSFGPLTHEGRELPIVRSVIDAAEPRDVGPRSSTARFPGLRVATVAGPWGPIRVATTPRGVIAIAVLSPLESFVAEAARRTRLARQTGTSPLLDRAVAAIERFFAGDAVAFRGLPLDLDDRPEWDRAVLGGVRQLRRGEVTTYGRLARRIGRPGAARAVGGAIGRNPIGLAIPCHRVIAGDGSIGGYGGDWFGSREQLLEIKRDLLAREGIQLPLHLAD